MTLLSTSATLPRDARVLLSGLAVDAVGTGITIPFFAIYLHEVRGVPLETVGVLAAVPSATALLLLAPVGVLIDAVGPRRILIGAQLAASAAALVLSQARAVEMALLARVLLGAYHAMLGPASNALVAATLPPAQRQRYFGVSFSLLNAGIGVGGLIGAAIADVRRPTTFEFIYACDAGSFLVTLGLLLGPLRHLGNVAAARGEEGVAMSYREVARDRVLRRLLVLGFVSMFIGYGQIEGGWTPYANTVARVSTGTIGIAFAVNTSVIVALQLVVLRLMEGRRRTRLLMSMAALWTCSWALMGVAGLAPGSSEAAVTLVVAFGVFGVGETLLSPIGPALLSDVAPERGRGRYNAIAGIASQLGAISAPIVAGMLLGRGHAAAYIAMLVGGSVALAGVAWWVERRLPAHANGVRVDDDGER